MGCCGNQEEEPVVGEDLELGLDGSAVDEIETYEQSVEKMLGVSSGVQIALGVMAVIQVLVVCVLAWLAYQYYHHSTSTSLHTPQYPVYPDVTGQIDGMGSGQNELIEDGLPYSPMGSDDVSDMDSQQFMDDVENDYVENGREQIRQMDSSAGEDDRMMLA
eukprot:91791_1